MTLQGGCYCGAVRYEAPDEIDVTTCSLDDPELAPPQDHTFAAQRVRWLHTLDNLPAYPRTRSEGQNE